MDPADNAGRARRLSVPKRHNGGTLLGVIIGFVLGLGVAAAIAWC